MKNILQKIGTGLLTASVVLLLMEKITICYLVLAAVLLIDLWLVKKKEKTITQWYRAKFPKLVDTILTIGLVVLFVWMAGPEMGLYFLIGTINGHLNGDW